MKITPMAPASQASAANQAENASMNRAASARDKAIQALLGNTQAKPDSQAPLAASPESPVQNANQVQPEELTAIQPKVNTQESRQEDPSVAATTPQAQKPTEQKPEDNPLSSQYAQLARQEKALRAKATAQEQAFAKREADLAAREAKLSEAPQFDPTKYIAKDSFKNDYMRYLAEQNISYDEVAQGYMNQVPTDPRAMAAIDELRNEIKSLKSENDSLKDTYKQNQDQAYKQAVAQIDREAKNLVDSDPVAYEAIHKTGKHSEITKLIERTYAEDGVLMTVEDAAQEIENFLLENVVETASRIDKIKQRLAPVAPKPETSSAQPVADSKQQQPQQIKTLTNATGSSKKLSARERAIAAFHGQPKS